VWLLQSAGGRFAGEAQALVASSISRISSPDLEAIASPRFFIDSFQSLFSPVSQILIGLLLSGVTVSLVQTGPLWASKRLGFQIQRLNPASGFKRLFSPNGLVELIKALFKLIVVGWPAYSYLRGQIDQVIGMAQQDLFSAVTSCIQLAVGLWLRVSAAYLVLAFVDYAYQRWQYMRAMRMTKEEIKEDFKATEGDPIIRGRIRGQQRRMARMRMMAKVPQADVVITNPTHLAVAIQYVPAEMRAPRVVAKGADRVAERIVKIAREHRVPVVQNIPVARALFGSVEIEQEVPPDLYAALAEVLAYVYKLRGRSFAAG
jgi:flagellar biosynthetic protein FlhB